MKTLKILHIQCGPVWDSMPGLLEQFKAPAKKRVNLEIEPISRNFINIPFESSGEHSQRVASDWVKNNIQPLGSGYDQIMVTLPNSQWQGIEENGTTYNNLGLPVVSIIHADEGEILWGNPLYYAWLERMWHEVFGHAWCVLTNRPDDSHYYETDLRIRLNSDIALARYDFDRYSTITELKERVGILTKAADFLKSQIAALLADKLSPMEKAIIKVESNGNDYAYNPDDMGSPSYGCMQIKSLYLIDVNTFAGTNYTPQELIGNRELSVWVHRTYMKRYATKERLGRAPTDQDKARIHNGGPNGYKNPKTEAYWLKVKKYL